MKIKVCSVGDGNNGGVVIEVECHITKGLPAIVIVGVANKSVDEAKERLRGAFSSSKIALPTKRITINLAPADIPKEGSGFDLAIAAAIILENNDNKEVPTNKTVIIGELGLDGSVRAVRGIIGKLLTAKQAGLKTFYIPEANVSQAMLVPDIKIIPVVSLRDLYLDLTNTLRLQPRNTGKGSIILMKSGDENTDFSQIVGQMQAKRALEIAAAGSHNILLNGPPGTGKSMLAKALPSILPPMNHEEVLEVTHLHSLAHKNYEQIITSRPFRSPHHSSSSISIIGGGQNPKPGEITLSHNGVLFFDELPEFSRSTIEALRQPLEDKTITVARAKESINFPANFIFVGTSNPCPCGYYNSSKECVCLPQQINKYQTKLSGPILDRIDIHVFVNDVKHKNLLSDKLSESSSQIYSRVTKAREIQAKRFSDLLESNATMNNKQIKSYAKLSKESKELFDTASEKLGLSARGYIKTIKVARTIADLDGSVTVESPHLTEALQYRSQLLMKS